MREANPYCNPLLTDVTTSSMVAHGAVPVELITVCAARPVLREPGEALQKFPSFIR
jgi:hypothetical protein